MTVSGMGTTFNLPNFVGELFHITSTETKFLSMIGGLHQGGRQVTSKAFTWQDDDNPSPTQPAIVEGADPTYEERERTERSNVVQIFQYGVNLSYTQQAAVGQLGSGATAILGDQPVQSESARQLSLKLKHAAREVNYSFLQGAYANPANNSTGRKTRGMKNAITTNTVALAGARANRNHFQELFRTMASNDAPFENVVIFCREYNRQLISDIYGYVPESRTVGGLNIQQIETEFGLVGVAYEKQMPTDEIYAIDLAFCKPAFLEIPGKGHFFIEPMSKSGAADKWQLYGEIGLQYGPEKFHGSLTGTATA